MPAPFSCALLTSVEAAAPVPLGASRRSFAEAHLHWLFFDCMVDPDSGRYLSEDYAFCRRWRDIGGKIWVDLQCKLLHLGQHNFRGFWFFDKARVTQALAESHQAVGVLLQCSGVQKSDQRRLFSTIVILVLS